MTPSLSNLIDNLNHEIDAFVSHKGYLEDSELSLIDTKIQIISAGTSVNLSKDFEELLHKRSFSRQHLQNHQSPATLPKRKPYVN